MQCPDYVLMIIFRHVANTAESSQGTARADDSDLVETSAGLNAGVQVTGEGIK